MLAADHRTAHGDPASDASTSRCTSAWPSVGIPAARDPFLELAPGQRPLAAQRALDRFDAELGAPALTPV